MKKIPMTTSTFKYQGKTVTIPGGWIAMVPEVKLIPGDLVALARSLEDEYPRQHEAEIAAQATISATFTQGWVRNLRLSIQGWARKYARFENALTTQDGLTVLRGFRPELIAPYYWPGDGPVGRKGKVDVMNVMRIMYQTAMRGD